jgi:hypothetical protein
MIYRNPGTPSFSGRSTGSSSSKGPYRRSIFLFSCHKQKLSTNAVTPHNNAKAQQIHDPSRYSGAWLEGKTFVPKRGPHCPTVMIIQSPPARFELVQLVFAFQMSTIDVATKIRTAKNVPTYLDITDVVAPRRINPTAERKAKKAANGPRRRTLSESILTPMMRRKHKKYGGARRPFDSTVVNEPISETIVGRNKGREAKLTLLLKFIIAKR